MNALVPSGTREMHFVLKEGPLREKLPVPVVIGGRRSHMVANANDCVGEVLMRVRFATKTEVRRPRGTVSINCSGPLRLCEEIGQVMRRHPGCPLVVSSDAPARAPLELVPQFGRISFSIEFCEGSESEEDGETWDDVLNAPMPHMSVEALPALYVSDDGIWRSEVNCPLLFIVAILLFCGRIYFFSRLTCCAGGPGCIPRVRQCGWSGAQPRIRVGQPRCEEPQPSAGGSSARRVGA